MRIGNLINNSDFSFGAPFRILYYDSENWRTTVVFDSEKSGDVPFDIMDKYITAINTGDDGILEIEYTDLIGEIPTHTGENTVWEEI